MKLEMKYEKDKIVEVYVVLSERNILSLLDKLYWDASARTLITENVPKGMRALVVTAENDIQHYGKAIEELDTDIATQMLEFEREPGELHPRTESVLEEIKAIYGKEDRS